MTQSLTVSQAAELVQLHPAIRFCRWRAYRNYAAAARWNLRGLR